MFGQRTSSISRQFTDSERALDDRVTALLESPTINPNRGGSLGEVYAGIRDDLSFRSTLVGQLNKEQDLAYQQSARAELARQAQENDDYAEQAAIAFNRVAEGARAGRDFKELVSEEMANTPGLALNPMFAKQAQEFGQYYESGEDRAFRQVKRDVDALELGTKKFSLEAMAKFREENPLAADQMIEQASKALETGGIAADNQLLAAQVQHAKLLKEYQESQVVMSKWNVDGLSSDPDPALGGASPLDQLAVLRDSFNQAGLNGLRRPQELVKNAPFSVKQMLANKDFLVRALPAPEDRQLLVEALNTMNDPSDSVTAEQREDAQNFVLDLAGAHARQMGDIPREEEERKQKAALAKEVGKSINDSWNKISKSIVSIAKSDDLSKTERTSSIISEGYSFLEQVGFLVDDQAALSKIQEEYRGYLNQVSGDPDTSSSRVRTLMGNYISTLKGADLLPKKPGEKKENPDKPTPTPTPGNSKSSGSGTKTSFRQVDTVANDPLLSGFNSRRK